MYGLQAFTSSTRPYAKTEHSSCYIHTLNSTECDLWVKKKYFTIRLMTYYFLLWIVTEEPDTITTAGFETTNTTIYLDADYEICGVLLPIQGFLSFIIPYSPRHS